MKPDPASLLSGRPQATKLPSTTPGEMHASEDFTAFTGGWTSDGVGSGGNKVKQEIQFTGNWVKAGCDPDAKK